MMTTNTTFSPKVNDTVISRWLGDKGVVVEINGEWYTVEFGEQKNRVQLRIEDLMSVTDSTDDSSEATISETLAHMQKSYRTFGMKTLNVWQTADGKWISEDALIQLVAQGLVEKIVSGAVNAWVSPKWQLTDKGIEYKEVKPMSAKFSVIEKVVYNGFNYGIVEKVFVNVRNGEYSYSVRHENGRDVQSYGEAELMSIEEWNAANDAYVSPADADKPADDEPQTDIHGNALCERCHTFHIFYADSERYCQSCLLKIESDYDAKLAREEAQSLYYSDSGVDADDYRAYIDANAPELLVDEQPAVQNKASANEQRAAVKLTDANEEALKELIQQRNFNTEGFRNEGFVVTGYQVSALVKKGLLEYAVFANGETDRKRSRLTDAGHAYATERGWLAPASAQTEDAGECAYCGDKTESLELGKYDGICHRCFHNGILSSSQLVKQDSEPQPAAENEGAGEVDDDAHLQKAMARLNEHKRIYDEYMKAQVEAVLRGETPHMPEPLAELAARDAQIAALTNELAVARAALEDAKARTREILDVRRKNIGGQWLLDMVAIEAIWNMLYATLDSLEETNGGK